MRPRAPPWAGWLGALASAFVACSHDWAAFDPRGGDDTSSAATGVGGSASASGSGGAGAVGGSATGGGASGTGAAGAGGAGGGVGGSGGSGGAPQSGSVVCAAHFTTVGSTYLRRVMVDSTGGIVVVGPMQGGADYGGGLLAGPPGVDTAAIAKLDASCQHVWSKVFPGAGGKTYFWAGDMWPNGDVAAVGGISGAADFGGGPLTPIGLEDLVVVRFDPAGNHVWSKAFGLAGANQWPQSAAIDPAGDVVVFGFHYAGGSFGGATFTGDGMFVVKLSGTTGAHVWSKSFACPSARPRSVAIDGTGAIFLTGRFDATADFGGTMLVATGAAHDGFIVKLDASGDTVWGRRFGSATGTASDYGHAVALDGAGGLVLTGRFEDTLAFDSGPVTSAGARDIFLTRLDGSGMSSWTKRFGGALFDSALGMAVDGAGSIALAGRFEGTTDLGGVALTSDDDADAFVARYDAAGNHLWSERFGGVGYQSASNATTDAAGNVFVTGYFDGTMAVGNRSFVPTAFDGFVLVLSP